MKELTLIYHFQASQNQNEEFKPARYKMVYFFGEEGMVPTSVILEILKAFPDCNFQDQTFLNLDDLKAFVLRVGQELDAGQIRLLSVQDYNIGVDGAKDIKSFRELFTKYGELIMNESMSKKKSFFGKLFS